MPWSPCSPCAALPSLHALCAVGTCCEGVMGQGDACSGLPLLLLQMCVPVGVHVRLAAGTAASSRGSGRRGWCVRVLRVHGWHAVCALISFYVVLSFSAARAAAVRVGLCQLTSRQRLSTAGSLLCSCCLHLIAACVGVQHTWCGCRGPWYAVAVSCALSRVRM